MPRRPFIAANWKMNPAPAGFDAAVSPYRTAGSVDVVVFPAFTDLHRVRQAELVYGALYGRPEPKGPFTGDISMQMLKEEGCRYVLCGHSERRRNHGETDMFIATQIVAALEAGMHPVLCIGESAQERKEKKTETVLKRQMESLSLIADLSPLIIAYEPVWAIGSGAAATAEQAQEAQAYIRSLLPENVRNDMRLLYGGSVDDKNAADLLGQDDIDGFLIGGSSLDPAVFGKIIAIAKEDPTAR